jgi:hypothetical protein
LLRIQSSFPFSTPTFDPSGYAGYTPVDLNQLLASGDLFQSQAGLDPRALQMVQAQLLATFLMQLDPATLLQLIMFGMTASPSGQGCGCHLGHMGQGRDGFSNRRSLPNDAWSRNAPSSNGAACVPGSVPTGQGTSGDFLRAALSQNGDRYIFGAETRMNDPNPSAFDCSELVQWAGGRAGLDIPDGANNQRDWCRRNGTQISVEEALRTPGALLFRDGHVAISLGDGRTIEARGRNYGVGVFDGSGRFTSAGLVPGMSYA